MQYEKIEEKRKYSLVFEFSVVDNNLFQGGHTEELLWEDEYRDSQISLCESLVEPLPLSTTKISEKERYGNDGA